MRKTLSNIIKLIVLLTLWHIMRNSALAQTSVQAYVNDVLVEQNQIINVKGGETFSFEISGEKDVRRIDFLETEDGEVFRHECFWENVAAIQHEITDVFPGGSNLTISLTVTTVEGGMVQRETYQYHVHYQEYAEFSFGDSMWGVMLEKYTGNMSTVIVPDEYEGEPVRVIGWDAFSDYNTLMEVVLPDTIEYIKEGAFSGSGLVKISLPDSLRVIEDSAFSGCNLFDLELPAGITIIEPYAFSGNDYLQEILLPTNLREIRKGAFSGCESLESIIIPESVTTIDDEAFKWCSSLKRVQLPERLRTIGTDAFAYCTELQEIDLPMKLEEIGCGAFAYDYNMKEVQIPDSVYYISGNPFYGTSIHFVISDSHPVFSFAGGGLYNQITKTLIAMQDPDMRELSISDDTRSIADHAFDLTGIQRVLIPSSLERIGAYAFSGTMIEDINLPESLVEIGESAFMACKRLKSVYIPNHVRILWPSIFAGCDALSDIKLSDGLTSIPETMLFACDNLVEVDIPASVSVIEPFALQNCGQLKAVYIYGKITHVGKNAFPDFLNDLVVFGFGDDAAEAFCNETGIQYKRLSGIQKQW